MFIAKSKLPANKPKKLKSKGVKLRRKKPEPIVIDKDADLVFQTEKDLYAYFDPQIKYYEELYHENKKEGDIDEANVSNMEQILDLTLEEPAEIWHDDKTFSEFPVFCFIRPLEELQCFHVATCYVSSEDEPTFIFFHFLTQDLDLVGKYRRGDLVYDRAFEEVGFAAIEGDALSEGDPMAMGLFLAMLKLRSEKDVSFDLFQKLGEELREETIENADEIWRNTDHRGNSLVTFIKYFPDHEVNELYYLAVTQEDPNSAVHTLMFSFPTHDISLVDRYRHGENLQADEVVQESSH